MKVLISVDMEGISGVATRRETATGWPAGAGKGNDYERARGWMTADANAAVSRRIFSFMRSPSKAVTSPLLPQGLYRASGQRPTQVESRQLVVSQGVASLPIGATRRPRPAARARLTVFAAPLTNLTSASTRGAHSVRDRAIRYASSDRARTLR